jgi:hypothetical protein
VRDLARVARRLLDRAGPYWDKNPRWQTPVVRSVMRKAVGSRFTSPDTLAGFELLLTRALGQPLSRRAWSRMTFNDKVTYRRLLGRDPRFVVFSDKLRAQAYVADRLGPRSVPKVLAVADRADAFADLPGPFALKANHGSHWVILVDSARHLTHDERDRAQSWLGIDYGGVWREWGYRYARRLLFAEELLAAEPPPDFKFLVFDGRPEVVHVDLDRYGAHRRVLMRPDWSLLGRYDLPLPDELPARPPNLKQMLDWATVLSEGMNFVRVDMYDLGERVVVGEMTCYPGAGRLRFRPEQLDDWLGSLWARPA